MFSCRAAWQRCGPWARKAALRLPRDATQHRLMSSVPGGSGENIVYAVLCGGAFVGALAYTYSTISSDSARYAERMEMINARPKPEWVPKIWPPKSTYAEEDGEEEEAVAEEPSGDADIGGAEAAGADNETETKAEAEAAEVIAEALEEVAEVAQEVEAIAEEDQIVEAVEEVAQAVTEPVADAAEEPGSNGMTSPAEGQEVASEA